MKSKRGCSKHKCKHINLKPITPKYEVVVGFFLEGDEEAFLMVDNYPFNKLSFPSVGDRVNLESYGDFDFDCFIVEEMCYNLCNPEIETLTYIEVTVSGHYFEA